MPGKDAFDDILSFEQALLALGRIQPSDGHIGELLKLFFDLLPTPEQLFSLQVIQHGFTLSGVRGRKSGGDHP
jgi:hypothetical protein